jgi:hypothetical protein
MGIAGAARRLLRAETTSDTRRSIMDPGRFYHARPAIPKTYVY